MRKVLTAIVAASLLAATAGLATGASTKVQELYADLTGAAETPAGAQNGKGTVELRLNDVSGRVCWEFKGVRGLEGKALQAHIHKGKAGKNGDVVVPLGESYRAEGCAKATKKLVRAILAKPGSYYVNIHNDKYPAGAIRGQLETSDD